MLRVQSEGNASTMPEADRAKIPVPLVRGAKRQGSRARTRCSHPAAVRDEPLSCAS